VNVIQQNVEMQSAAGGTSYGENRHLTECGNAIPQHHIGSLHETDVRVRKDCIRVVEYDKASAVQGNAIGPFNYGRCLMKCYGCDANLGLGAETNS
jgi:hypothetical protein